MTALGNKDGRLAADGSVRCIFINANGALNVTSSSPAKTGADKSHPGRKDRCMSPAARCGDSTRAGREDRSLRRTSALRLCGRPRRPTRGPRAFLAGFRAMIHILFANDCLFAHSEGNACQLSWVRRGRGQGASGGRAWERYRALSASWLDEKKPRPEGRGSEGRVLLLTSHARSTDGGRISR